MMEGTAREAVMQLRVDRLDIVFVAGSPELPDCHSRRMPGDPKVWFTSMESFAKVLSAGNRELLRVMDQQAPGSLEELAEITGRAKSNLSRTLKRMASYGLVRMEKGEGRKLTPRVVHDRVELTCR